LTSGF